MRQLLEGWHGLAEVPRRNLLERKSEEMNQLNREGFALALW